MGQLRRIVCVDPKVDLQGRPHIEIKFEIDAHRILTVYGKSGIGSKVILNEYRLTAIEINNMVKEAETFVEIDKKKEIVDVKKMNFNNMLVNLNIYNN